MIREIRYASALVYSKSGTSGTAERSRQLRDRIKRVDDALYLRIARRIHDLAGEGHFRAFLGADVLAVPVPGHAPLVRGSLGNTTRIAEALRSVGLVGAVLPALERVRRVAKSAFSPPSDRPRAADHFESLSVHPVSVPHLRLLLVDDFITRGATLLGAGARLHAACPQAEIRAFALVRSETASDIPSIVAPCEGVVTLMGSGETQRRP